MKPLYRPICHFCQHFYPDSSPPNRYRGKCAAFPEGIPKLIIDMDYDHREPYPGDNGTQFEKYESRETLHVDLSKESDETLHQQLEHRLKRLSQVRREGAILPPFIDEDPQDSLQYLRRLYKKYHLPPDDSEDPIFWMTLIDETIFPAWLLEALIKRAEDVIKNR